MARDDDKFLVRMPDGMRDKIAEMAERYGRSMNSEIVYRLQLTMDMSDKAIKADPAKPRDYALTGLEALKGRTMELTEFIEAMEKQLKKE